MNGFQINDGATLNDASAVAHDGTFRMSDIEFDEISGVFRLVFHSPDATQAQYHRIFWPISMRIIPFGRWQLTFWFVHARRVCIENDTNARSLLFEIATIRLDEGGTKLIISTHFELLIELSISALSGEIRKIPGPSALAPWSRMVIRVRRD